MRVVPLVEDGEQGERTCLSTRPHWFWVLKQGLVGLALLATGLTLMLFSSQIYQLLRGWVPNGLTLPGGSDEAGPVSGVTSGFDLSLSTAFAWGPIILMLLGSVVLGWALLQRRFTEYAITISPSPHFGGRIIKAQGILSRQTVAVPLVMVNDLLVQEPLLGRILGWGNVDIETGNDYQGDRLEYVPNPRQFYEAWASLLDGAYSARQYRLQHPTHQTERR